MNLSRLRFAWAVLAAALAAANASAQVGQIGQYQRPYNPQIPTFSPYLNMFRGGNAAINYFGIVQPQLETQGRLNMLQNEVMLQSQMGMGMGNSMQIPQGPINNMTTGHPVAFSNTGSYFPAANGKGLFTGTGGPTGRASPFVALSNTSSLGNADALRSQQIQTFNQMQMQSQQQSRPELPSTKK